MCRTEEFTAFCFVKRWACSPRHWWIGILPHGTTAPSGPGPPHYQGFMITLNTAHLLGLLWLRDRPKAETPTWQHTTLTRDRHLRPPVGFETIIPGSKWPQTHALDHVALGLVMYWCYQPYCSSLSVVPLGSAIFLTLCTDVTQLN